MTRFSRLASEGLSSLSRRSGLSVEFWRRAITNQQFEFSSIRQPCSPVLLALPLRVAEPFRLPVDVNGFSCLPDPVRHFPLESTQGLRLDLETGVYSTEFPNSQHSVINTEPTYPLPRERSTLCPWIVQRRHVDNDGTSVRDTFVNQICWLL